MIALKIQCGCGQRYAFDVEPVAGRMPANVGCPVCGLDGTDAANAMIARNILPTPPPPAMATSTGANRENREKHSPNTTAAAMATAPVGGIRVHAARPAVPESAQPHPEPAEQPSSPHRPSSRLPGQIDRTQAEHEARAKIFWGDPPEDVVKFLAMQGVPRQEASDIVQALFQERAVTIRKNGVKKMGMGTGLACVPVAAFIVFHSMSIFPIKLFAMTLMVGCYGGWTFLKGAIMFFAPKSEPGDVAEQ